MYSPHMQSEAYFGLRRNSMWVHEGGKPGHCSVEENLEWDPRHARLGKAVLRLVLRAPDLPVCGFHAI